MSRSHFTLVERVPVGDILLDVGNPRIRAGQDQRQCVERILRKLDHMTALMRDIAERGLTTMPIIVKPTADGHFVVMDGNRRITALKLLNSPETCPDERLKPMLRDLLKKNRATIPAVVDVMSSESDDAIAMEVLARHSGEQAGVGQVNWSAYLRTVYLLNHGHPPDYKRPGQYALWSEEQGIYIDDEFPITSLQRFFSIENLAQLGFQVDRATDELVSVLPVATVKRMAQFLMSDFESERIKVDDIRRPEQALAYIKTVRAHVGLLDTPSSTPAPAPSAPAGAPSTGRPTGSPAGDPTAAAQPPTSGAGATSPPSNAPRAAPTPREPANERSRLFGKGSPGLPIPDSERKAATIVAEIRTLTVKGDKSAPIAVGMLLRHLIEISDEYYREQHSLGIKSGGLGKSVHSSAAHMKDSQRLTVAECDMVSRLANPGTSSTDLLHIETLQKMMHRGTHLPTYQLLNTFWDHMAPFIRACWVR
jgi:ParB-like nuclease domain